jgi:MFS family permease
VNAQAGTAREGADRRRWLAMPFIALGVAMIIVNVAIPTIIRELHTTAASAEWVNSIYSLVFAALLITLGRVGDMFGRRRLFLIGTVWFVLASLVAATASSSGVLIFGRFLQGIGGAMILPSTLSTVNSLFRGRERAIAFAIWGSCSRWSGSARSAWSSARTRPPGRSCRSCSSMASAWGSRPPS